ncbi:7-deoxyloganetin glucosyltransferase-like [Cucumis melo var. makuwa]|uniref:7-deoxyloganetin glucosyltransferase-like n=2 Tax=Cucumis melo TaxID=3656 RepID=A0A5A7SPR0_CUCMM|nr:7-deoxyloganetin glucosyltransferase-like [Cucumis melo var. makuwa]TYK06921.1 7-deoxyloganetin glucosyltransferase-like [Cucumis melo var. makuwa]
MGSISKINKPHAVCLPHPPQGHLNPMLILAKLLHHKGFYVTFVNTEYNHRRLLKSRGPNSLDGLPDFKFRTIPDGLPYSDANCTQDVPSLCQSVSKNCLAPFRELISELNSIAASPSSSMPPVTCVVSDSSMSFAMLAANEFNIPCAFLWTSSPCGYLGYTKFEDLVKQGVIPLKDESQITDGYLENTIEWTKAMERIRLRDMPSFLRTTDPDDIMLNFFIQEVNRALDVDAVILNTFDALDQDVIGPLSSNLKSLYTIGPLHKLLSQIHDDNLTTIGSNLWAEESECIEWLNSKEPNSVVYVNFGSITVMTPQQLIEFAWGLADSGKPFLWIARPDLVVGDSTILPPEFVTKTKDRSLIASWCNQEQVFNHPAIGGFLTHCGWNSTIETVSAGIPVVCWPFFADQQTSCCYCCNVWEIGMEIDNNVKRNEVEKLVRELMDGEKGKKMKENAMNLKSKAEEAYKPGGLSWKQLDKLINEVLLSKYEKNPI